MDPDLRTRAEARLGEAASAHGLTDPRPLYRERLRVLRQTDRAAFDRAIVHYEQRVLPALAQDDPLPVWLQYGEYLASLTAAGRMLTIDTLGRASPWQPGAPIGLVLFMPAQTADDVLVLAQPESPSPAQQATITLLVERRMNGSGV